MVMIIGVQHFKTPQNVIQDYYHQKNLKSVTLQKSTKVLMLGRSNQKRSLQELYLKEYWLSKVAESEERPKIDARNQ